MLQGVKPPEKCDVCLKRVYPLERIQADGRVFHNQCFRCTQCRTALTLGSYASLDSKVYCRPHFKQLFALKGSFKDFEGPKPPAASPAQPAQPPLSTSNLDTKALLALLADKDRELEAKSRTIEHLEVRIAQLEAQLSERSATQSSGIQSTKDIWEARAQHSHVIHTIPRSEHPVAIPGALSAPAPATGEQQLSEPKSPSEGTLADAFCASCAESLALHQASQVIKALGKWYCREHFACFRCHTSLVDQTLISVDNQPHCEPCGREIAEALMMIEEEDTEGSDDSGSEAEDDFDGGDS
eukprot:TRINITY_DN10906_c0_g1_i1.p1 TRINITY_DN10906_c0_g1~~TRINITY_DN10906_c0_g1_i1.p1  ORF type:complete len:298 (+),score=49.33 TRINITY_DN10906_c0_g1_i1:3-896(+)